MPFYPAGPFPSNPLCSLPETQKDSHRLSFYYALVEHRGFEPLTSTLRTLRATNCANAPYSLRAGDAAASTDNGYNSTTVCKLQALFLLFSAMCDDCIVAERDSDEPIDDQRAVCPHSRRRSFFPTSSCIQYTVGRVRSQILMQNGLSWFGGKPAYFPASLFKRLDGAGTEARKAAVSARKAEDHAERRRPVNQNQPRGLNRRESAPFDSARRCGCSTGIPRSTFFGFTAVTPPM